MMSWHRLAAEEVLRRLSVEPGGLTSEEAARRSLRDGPNELPDARRTGPVRMFMAQFTDFMIIVLLIASAVSALVGDLKDALVIMAILVINAVIGFAQEYRAEKAMAALKAMASPVASILRDGSQTTLPSSRLVVGDIVLLEAGRIVPADLRILQSFRLTADESSLTGESIPVEKTDAAMISADIPIGDRRSMAYRGTVITYGRGKGVVVAVGPSTEFGKIAAMLADTKDVKTPLQKRLAQLGKRLSLAALVICAAVFTAGLLRGEDLTLMFMTAVSLAVAAIPESLPAVVTISLALGAGKIARQNALVRKLPAVETLGSVTVICTDKTGTLTMNRMRVDAFYCAGVRSSEPGNGGSWPHLLRAMALCSDTMIGPKGEIVGDPTETALVEGARRGGILKEDLEKSRPRVLEIPFDADRKRMTTFHQDPDGGFISYTKGALDGMTSDPLLLEAAEELASEGLRVLAFSMKRWDQLPSADQMTQAEAAAEILGLVGLIDPPREEAKEAVSMCKSAGIVPVMITGDHPGTARAVAQRLGILGAEGRVMTGPELEALPMGKFESIVKDIRVYARVSPGQKLKIVTALQDKGEYVAMTGDGVNDAPALKKADIGVAMGITGSDVAKEAGSMILLDDNFATIVRAVKEGRRIYDNMRRFVRYAVTTNSAEVWIIFAAPLLGLPIPFLPIQILWINLLTDGLPGLALASEPAEPDVMRRPPRPPKEGVFSRGLGLHVIWVGLFMSALVLGCQAFAIRADQENWRSFIFTVLCFSQLAHVLAIRSESVSLFRHGLLSNKPLFFTVSLTVVLQLCTLYLPALNEVFHTRPLSGTQLSMAFVISLSVLFAVELEKWLRRR